jgi:hypothetical protein
VYTGAGVSSCPGRKTAAGSAIRLGLLVLERTTIKPATPSTATRIHPIAIPAIAPAGKLVPFPPGSPDPAVGSSEVMVEGDIWLPKVVVGMGPFAGFVSYWYKVLEGLMMV